MRYKLALAALLAVFSLSLSQGLVSAYTGPDLDAKIPNAKGNILTLENNCTADLNNQASKSINGRQKVNASNPYRTIDWISSRSSPGSTSVTVPYGTTTVPLQLNSALFICAALAKNSNSGVPDSSNYCLDKSALAYDGSGVESNKYCTPTPPDFGSYPADRAVVDGDGAARYLINTRINSGAITSGPGTLSSLASKPLQKTTRDNDHRYWFANTVDFNYQAPAGGLTTTTTVIIQFNETQIYGYHPPASRVYQCNGNSSLKNDSDFDNKCKAYDTPKYAITITVSPPPVVLDCTGTSFAATPAIVEPGEHFGGTVNVHYSGGTPTGSYGFKVTIDGVDYPVKSTSAYAGGYIQLAVNDLIAPGGLGEHTASWQVTGSGGPVTCNGTFKVAHKPYVRIYGGDILAGAGFKALSPSLYTCSSNTNAGITGFNDGHGAGSAVQFAAQALAKITGFSSAAGRIDSPVAPNGLSFANTPEDGRFGAADCLPDYYAGHPSAPKAFDGGSGRYYYDSAQTLGPTTIAAGTRVTLYVKDKLVITGQGITYGGTSWPLNKIPSLYIIVKGDIYIDSSVHQLDGVYMAQPIDATHGGHIYTCTQGGSLYPLNLTAATGENQQYISDCSSKLTVNGAFAARTVKFQRVNGSRQSSSNGEDRGSATIAESFVYSPELWLVQPLTGQTDTSYSSITSLPPVL